MSRFNNFLSIIAPLIMIILMINGAAAQTAEGRRATTRASDGASHILAVNDLIELKVFQEPELDALARIPADGRVTIPLVGEISVVGKSVREVSLMIKAGLAAKFLVDPQVTLTVVESARRVFTILGQVQRPGTYRFPDLQSLNILQVIGIAGGYTRLASPSRITVKRAGKPGGSLFKINAKRLARESRTAQFDIQNGDIITVAERLF